MADFSNCPFSLSSLFCPEDGSHLAPDEEEHDELNDLFIFFNDSSLSQADDEYVDTLVSKERSLLCGEFSVSETSLLRDISESVRWILKMKSFFRFGSQTAYLAATYLNRFFLRRTIDEGKNWATKLLSIACLSLAAKLEECSPPLLSEYCLEDYCFSSEAIQRMELLVLDTLEWKLNAVTPFAYLSYFASKFDFDHCSKDHLSKAISFIFYVLEGAECLPLFLPNIHLSNKKVIFMHFNPNPAMNLMDYRPSAIAAAAILAASGDKLTKKLLESKMSLVSLSESVEIEHVFSCYNAMIQQSKKEKIRPRKSSFSLDVSETCSKRRKLQCQKS